MMAATSLTIRRASPDDASAIARVLYESFVEFRALYTDGGFAATALGAEQILIRMREGPVWVALRDGVVLGTVGAVAKGESAYVRGMAVLPAARGLGVGSALLSTVESWAVQQGHGRLFLSSTPFLMSAIRLYEGFGFRRVEEEPQDLFGTELFTMEKVAGSGRQRSGCRSEWVKSASRWLFLTSEFLFPTVLFFDLIRGAILSTLLRTRFRMR